MSDCNVDGVIITPQKIVDVEDGDVFHAMKSTDSEYSGFGEAYFSSIQYGAIKAWKRHKKMILNIVVPVGEIRFVIFDDRNPLNPGMYQQVNLSRDNYCRLTVPPMVWMGFQGVSRNKSESMLLNIASIPHNPNESDRKVIDEIEFDWSLN